MKKSTKRLLYILSTLNFTANHEYIEGITDKYDGLDWSIEALHIYAWIKHRQNWTVANWVDKLDKWGQLSSRKGRRGAPYASKTPNFDQYREEIEQLEEKQAPEWVEQEEEEDKQLGYEPESFQQVHDELGTKSPEYQHMLNCRRFCSVNNIDLEYRYNNLLKWLQWKSNTREQEDTTYRNLYKAISKGWFDDNGLMAWIGGNNWVLCSMIQNIIEPPAPAHDLEPVTCLESTHEPEEKQEEVEYLYKVVFKLKPHRIPLLGYVMKEEGDELHLYLPGPVCGKQEHIIPKSSARILKEEVKEKVPGNIERKQISEAITILMEGE